MYFEDLNASFGGQMCEKWTVTRETRNSTWERMGRDNRNLQKEQEKQINR